MGRGRTLAVCPGVAKCREKAENADTVKKRNRKESICRTFVNELDRLPGIVIYKDASG